MATPLITPDDKAFLRAIINSPGDAAPRLVYADWLDEQDTEDTRRAAEYLRGFVEFIATDPKDSNYEARREHLWRLEYRLPRRWLAVLELATIEECHALGGITCPGRWEKLRPTRDALLRCCDVCGKDVRYCQTLREAALHTYDGNPVVLPATLERHRGDLEWAIDTSRYDD